MEEVSLIELWCFFTSKYVAVYLYAAVEVDVMCVCVCVCVCMCVCSKYYVYSQYINHKIVCF